MRHLLFYNLYSIFIFRITIQVLTHSWSSIYTAIIKLSVRQLAANFATDLSVRSLIEAIALDLFEVKRKALKTMTDN